MEYGCCAGWHEFSDIHPNAAHEGLARLQQRGWVDAMITQNVDRLHQKAGATDVIELHGTTHRWLPCKKSQMLPMSVAGFGAGQGR